MKARNPFLCPHIGPGVQTFVAADRIEAVRATSSRARATSAPAGAARRPERTDAEGAVRPVDPDPVAQPEPEQPTRRRRGRRRRLRRSYGGRPRRFHRRGGPTGVIVSDMTKSDRATVELLEELIANIREGCWTVVSRDGGKRTDDTFELSMVVEVSRG